MSVAKSLRFEIVGLILVCGRFANHVKDMGRWAEILGDWPADVQTSYNIAPGANIATFTEAGGGTMRWGLVPAWSKTTQIKYATFNARSETLSSKPAFRRAWQHGQRCLIPMQGYYEWQTVNGEKQPFYISALSGEPLVCGGLWEQWIGDDGDDIASLRSCTMITRSAVGSMLTIHPRMPLLLQQRHAELWLRGSVDACDELLHRPPEADLHYYKVSQEVNNPRNQGVGILAPVDDE